MFKLKEKFQNWQRKTFLEPKKNEKLKELYLEIEKYFYKIYEINFYPNILKFNNIKYASGNKEFRESFGNYFAGYDEIDWFKDFKEKLSDKDGYLKPIALMDYLRFFKDKKIKYGENNLVKYIMTKLDGTTFEVDNDKINYIYSNVVEWEDGVSELFQKIEPVYVVDDKSLEWDWDTEISYHDIQDKYIDFKTEEERIMKYDF